MTNSKGSWGGSREGAGRKKTSPFVSHVKRPRVEGRRFPILVTLRLRSGLPSLLDTAVMEMFFKAASRARRFGLRLLEFRLHPKSAKFICEFKNHTDLEKSFKSLNTTLAIVLKKRFEAENGKKHLGPVFLGRFMMEEINDPRRYRLLLKEFFLENPDDALPEPLIGLSSSAPLFQQWRDLLGDSQEKRAGAPQKPGEKKIHTPSANVLTESGQSVPARLTHVEDLRKLKEVTASPQFAFSKLALKNLRRYNDE